MNLKQEEISITLENVVGHKIKAKVDNTSSARSLLDIVNNNSIYPSNFSNYKLIHNGNELHMDLSLISQNVKDNDRIIFIMKKVKNAKMRKLFLLSAETSLYNFNNFISDVCTSFLRASDLIFHMIDADKDATRF